MTRLSDDPTRGVIPPIGPLKWLNELNRKRNPSSNFDHFLFWEFGLRSWAASLWWALFGTRCFNSHRIPLTGPVLIVSNHQSFLDPIQLAIAQSRRQYFSMARKTLFDVPALSTIIRMLHSFPIDRGGSDRKALMHGVKLLRQGNALLVFAEGTRTENGQTQAFERGIMMLIKMAKPTVLPAAIEGLYDIWPRTRKFPAICRHPSAVDYGHPIDAQTLLDMPTHEALNTLQQQVEIIRLNLRTKLRFMTRGQFPPPGTADQPGIPVPQNQLIQIQDDFIDP